MFTKKKKKKGDKSFFIRKTENKGVILHPYMCPPLTFRETMYF